LQRFCGYGRCLLREDGHAGRSDSHSKKQPLVEGGRKLMHGKKPPFKLPDPYG
jgi:hypothetical protein